MFLPIPDSCDTEAGPQLWIENQCTSPAATFKDRKPEDPPMAQLTLWPGFEMSHKEKQ